MPTTIPRRDVKDARRKPKLVYGLLLILGLGWVGCTSERVFAPSPPEGGRTIYLEACSPCHGDDAKGDGPVAGSLKRRPPDLTRLAERNGGEFPRQLVLDVVTGKRQVPAHGDREMPVWGTAFSRESAGATVGAAIYTQRLLSGVTQYLESIQVRPSAGP